MKSLPRSAHHRHSCGDLSLSRLMSRPGLRKATATPDQTRNLFLPMASLAGFSVPKPRHDKATADQDPTQPEGVPKPRHGKATAGWDPARPEVLATARSCLEPFCKTTSLEILLQETPAPCSLHQRSSKVSNGRPCSPMGAQPGGTTGEAGA
uniref:Uncharacterized protein n=1 Tax=Oxyrrhis marina TaxID=2969 RepID=A0A7S4LNI8_OXYMA